MTAPYHHPTTAQVAKRQASRLPLFRPGGHYPDGDGYVRLSLSESGFGASALARRAVANESVRLQRYPDPGARSLAAQLAARHAVTPEHIVVGNGSDELLLLSALAFVTPEARVVVSASTYPGHRNAAQAARQTPVTVPLRNYRVDVPRIVRAMRPGSVVYVCNPHNPAGTALAANEVDALVLAAEQRRAVLVVDEAYMEFVSPGETRSAITHVRAGSPVIVLRTFSKLYGLAGLRCGYAIGQPALSAEIRKLKNVLVFNVNRLAQVAAEASLRDTGFAEQVRARTRSGLIALEAWLATQPWASPVPSVTNFVLLGTPWPTNIVAGELAQRRVLVRDCTDLGLPHHLRISVGSKAEMTPAQAALTDVAELLTRQAPAEGSAA